MIREDVCSFPLSLLQEGMWLTLQMTPASPAYNIPYLLALKGTLDKALLARALAESLARHESLRTNVAWQDEQIVQLVSETLALPYEEIDLRGNAEPEVAAHQAALAEAGTLFDLAHDPLIKVRLWQTGEEQYLLLFVLHHLISDGWSMEILLGEIAERYTASIEQRPPQLAPLPIQYADFAVWEREHLQGAVREARVAYWREALAGAPTLLTLPGAAARPAQHTLRGATHQMQWPRELADQLGACGQVEQCTLFMTLLAGWQAMLSAWTGQSDLVVGSPLANRTRPEVQGLLGLFSNMLPLRARLTPDLTWKQLLRQTRLSVLGANDQQDLPFEELVKALQPLRIPGVSPYFQVAFSLHQRQREALRLPEIAVRTLEIHNGASKFDLTLQMQQSPEYWGGTWLYSTDLFTPQTIEQLAAYLQRVLEHLVANPDAPMRNLPVPPQVRASLPPTQAEAPVPALTPASASQSALEQVIMEIWQQVLGFSEIEREDNFFDLGGYSLLMIRVQRQLQDVLQTEIPLTDLLRFPTVQNMATFLCQGYDTESALARRRERGRTREEALARQRTRRQASRQGGSDE